MMSSHMTFAGADAGQDIILSAVNVTDSVEPASVATSPATSPPNSPLGEAFEYVGSPRSDIAEPPASSQAPVDEDFTGPPASSQESLDDDGTSDIDTDSSDGISINLDPGNMAFPAATFAPSAVAATFAPSAVAASSFTSSAFAAPIGLQYEVTRNPAHNHVGVRYLVVPQANLVAPSGYWPCASKYYAVTRGRMVGVFNNPMAFNAAISRVSGPISLCGKDLGEAIAYFNNARSNNMLSIVN
ncbi:hypothetical protein BD626DRAFT_575851 [Schizophyllum amplum]|uniref:Uncharacterized protein n=1 Tax=Schizophyllum amplum TaxID=97359 RepID=A0A550BUV7_9AGAR|nr:hypothetical protein BD626DRAFT_575851 [Auriculariopsis ampla]